ncbi:MAG: RNA 2'-phosphotransferase [Candidatus Omnitrophota bacterium]
MSKFLSHVLRHDPEKSGLKPSEEGFVHFNDAISVLKRRFKGFLMKRF